MATTLPPTHKALVQEVKTHPLVVKELPTPQAIPGTAILRIISAPVISYMREVYDGTRSNYAYPTPLVPGTSAIGRVVATGPDAAKLKEGDLVLVDCLIRGRDDSEALFLFGLTEGAGEGSRKLMHGEWRDATFAQYAKVPLENCFLLNEARLLGPVEKGGLGYEVDQLCWLLQSLVPYGGLRSIDLKAGETVIIAPATGGFGSAAVVVALAMGARVIAMARNEIELKKIKALNPDRVEIVPMTGNIEEEIAALKKFGRINAFFDISPAAAQESTHFKSAVLSLTQGGRVSLMGGFLGDLPIPHRFIMRFDITLKGKWMYSRDDVFTMLQLMNTGVLNVKDIVKVVRQFGLEDWKKAFDVAYEQGGRLGQLTVFNP
jgi:threonine dehydrogenase-like Zn-dependent dehydrogenase